MRRNYSLELKIPFSTQLEIIKRTLSGESVVKISKDLHLSESTVRKYKKRYTNLEIERDKKDRE